MSQPSFVVTLSALALRDLAAIEAFFRAEDAPFAAAMLGDRLLRAIEDLEVLPFRGRVVAGNVRELVTVRPYVIRYRILTKTVQIIRIRHGARRPE